MAEFGKVMSLAELSGGAPEDSEHELRIKLAGTYRLFAHLGWDYLIFGHITVRVPGPDQHFLINPFGLRFDEVTASNLVKIDSNANIVEPSKHPVNPAGFFIHSAVHRARADAHCVMHTHTTAGMALAATQTEVLPVDFAGSAAYGRVGYHDFAGVHADESDSDALIKSLGSNNYLILRNHGLLTCGETIARAFQRMYWLETACQVQTAAHAMNVPIRRVPTEVARHHAQVLDGDDGELTLAAMLRLMEKIDPSFKD
ncbi:MAG: class II aldolase/adducin family protein [Pseudomonadota bacterium]